MKRSLKVVRYSDSVKVQKRSERVSEGRTNGPL